MKPYSLMFLLILVYCSLIWIDPASTRREKLFKNPFWSSRKDSLPLHQPEIQLVREWNRYPEIPPPPRTRWNSRHVLPPRHPVPKKHPSREPYPMADIVSQLFPGLSFTRQPPIHKEKEQHFNEIHVEIGNVDDLTNILGYDDIVLSIKDQKSESVLPRPDTERPSKPFWGPPIESLTTRTPKPFPFHLPSTTVPSIWQQTTPAGSKNPSEVRNNELLNKRPTAPTESFSWRPDDFVTPLVQLTNNDPFDGFWNSPTSESSLSNSPTLESPIFKPSENNHDSFDQQPETSSPPVIQQSRDIESGQQGAGIMATHPHPHTHVHPHTRQDYHPHHGYHPPAPSYHPPPPSLMKVDFSPLFLALIPLALVLGAAASFALSSAVTSNTAVATAQQQQQQQEASNSNNNANSNSNTNTILSLLAALNNNQDYQPYYVIVNGTSIATARDIRRRWEHKLMDLMSN